MPLQATSGAASYDGFGGGVAAVPNYIEDVFSTYLYTGTGATQTITNGIDLSGKGGMVWIKGRSTAFSNLVQDTARGAYNTILTDGSGASANYGGAFLSSFNSNGFSIGSGGSVSLSGDNFASWTFRKQPKFFDVVTWTGTGANRTISHALGSVPACIFVKRTDTTGDWQVYHRSLANTEYLVLNSAAAIATGTTRWNSTTPTSTVFSLGTDATVNASGGTYVAYIFAHNAGGFGLTGTNNVISSDVFFTDSSGSVSVDLGYEPQWILIKSLSTGNWYIWDTLRGFSYASNGYLLANTSGAEVVNTTTFVGFPTATGFTFTAGLTGYTNYIYIAIRRGPMKVPTSGTSVFSPITSSAATGTNQTTGFPVDMQIKAARAIALTKTVADRLRGVGTTPTSDIGVRLSTNLTSAETAPSAGGASTNWTNTGFANPSDTGGISGIYWNFRRAPGFFDEVCYTGTGANATRPHNLQAVPEMMIVKKRDGVANWAVYHSALGAAGYILLNTQAAASSGSDFWQSTTPTSTNFYTGINGNVGDSGLTYVAYLFATCAGVSKVGSYTGTGAAQTISCGFTGGARFVLIRRTDSSGNNWEVWDTARGMVAGTDPSIPLNTTSVESNANTIYTATGGFQIVGATMNVSGGTYIFLAIA